MGNSGLGLTQYELLVKWSIFKNAAFFSRCPCAQQAVVKSDLGEYMEIIFMLILVFRCLSFSLPVFFCLPDDKNMTLTCTTLDQHEHKNYLRPIFSFYALFDDMWCLLDFNSFPWYYNWPPAGIFLYEKTKKKPFLMQMRLNATHIHDSLHYTVMFSSAYWPVFLSNERQTQSWGLEMLMEQTCHDLLSSPSDGIL